MYVASRMSPQKTHLHVGDIECIALQGGAFGYTPDLLFSNVPKAELEDELRAKNLAADEILLPYTCLVIKSGGEHVLVDTGEASLGPVTGDLERSLKAAGLGREQISTVVLTHAHPDHIGGVIDTDGRAAFPNARYVMSNMEWDFWNSDSPVGAVASQVGPLRRFARNKLLPIKDNVELVQNETEVAPGVVVLCTPGHTPGHIAILISSGRQQLLHIADAVLHPLHLEYPSWRTIFDLEPEQAADTRRSLLDRAAADNSMLLAYHFPFPGFGSVKRKGNAWKWESLA